jgi:tryptophan halogenase
MEPLESTSIHLIQTSIMRLLSLFPDKSFDPDEIDEFNRQTTDEYEHTRDFLIAHYVLNTREDAPFWRDCANMAAPDGVRHKVSLFSAKGRLAIRQDSIFAAHSWTAVLLGQGVVPRGSDPLLSDVPEDEIEAQMREIRKNLIAAVSAMPSHQAFLNQYCPSAQPAAARA